MERQLTTLLGSCTSVTESELSDCYHSFVLDPCHRAQSHIPSLFDTRTVLALDPLADVLPLLAAARPPPPLPTRPISAPFIPRVTHSVMPPTVPNPARRWWAPPKLVVNPAAAPREKGLSRSREGTLKRSSRVPQALSKLTAPSPVKLVEHEKGSQGSPGEFGEWVSV